MTWMTHTGIRPTARGLVAAAVTAAALAGLAGCHEDEVWVPRLKGIYLPPTSPEVVVDNLVEAYKWQEVEAYARILAPEFVFKFQPYDASVLGFASWGRDLDSTATAGLFSTDEVGDIRISLVHGPAQAADTTFDPGVMRVEINPTQLEVDIIGGQNAGITIQADGDIQDLYFRKGKPALGEDPGHWFLLEWRDLPNPSGAPGGSVGASEGVANPLGTQSATWGRIKTLYAGLEFYPPRRTPFTSFKGGTP